jgi:hypothetical protein
MRKYSLAGTLLTIGFAAGTQPVDGQPTGTRRAIVDPVLNRNAYYVTIPANWKFEGTVYPGPECQENPMTVFRASSADGLTGVYLLPRIDWSWLTPAAPNIRDGAGCMPFHNDMPARDFLTYMIGVLKVGFVREVDTTAELAKMRRQTDELNAKSRPTTTFSTDAARFIVRYELNGHPIEELTGVTLSCSAQSFGGRTYLHRCSAFVKRLYAPLGQLQAQFGVFQTISASESFDQQWNAQWQGLIWAKNKKIIDDRYRAQTQLLLQRGQFAHDQLMRQHSDFMNSMQRGRDVNQYRFQEGQYNKQHASDDRVDYLLDCHRLQNGVSVGNCPSRQTAP